MSCLPTYNGKRYKSINELIESTDFGAKAARLISDYVAAGNDIKNVDNLRAYLSEYEAQEYIVESKNEQGAKAMGVEDVPSDMKYVDSLLDPSALTMAGYNATQGKQAVGFAASARNDISSYWSTAAKQTPIDDQNNLKRVDKELSKKRYKDYKILSVESVAKDNLDEFFYYARQAMNYSADSADVFNMIKPFQIGNMLWSKAFDSVATVQFKDGSTQKITLEGVYKPAAYNNHKATTDSITTHRYEGAVKKNKNLYEYLFTARDFDTPEVYDVKALTARSLARIKVPDPDVFALAGFPGLNKAYSKAIKNYNDVFFKLGRIKEAGSVSKAEKQTITQILEALGMVKSINSSKTVIELQEKIAQNFAKLPYVKDADELAAAKLVISNDVNYAKQLISQDMTDITTAIMLHGQVMDAVQGKSDTQKKSVLRVVADIAINADAFKKQFSVIMLESAKNQGVNKSNALDGLQAEIKTYRENILQTDRQRKLFDTYMLGSLRLQNESNVIKQQELYQMRKSLGDAIDQNLEVQFEALQESQFLNNANSFGAFLKSTGLTSTKDFYQSYSKIGNELSKEKPISKLEFQHLWKRIGGSTLDVENTFIQNANDIKNPQAVEQAPVTTFLQTPTDVTKPDVIKKADSDLAMVNKDMIKKDLPNNLHADVDQLPDDLVNEAVAVVQTVNKPYEKVSDYMNRILNGNIEKTNNADFLLRLIDDYDPNIKWSKDELVLIDDLKDLMGYHDAHNYPGWFVGNFLSYWRGTMQKNFNITVDPKKTTLYDMRSFLQAHRYGRDYIWNVMKGAKVGQFHWKNFFWFPDTIAKQSQLYDYKLESVVAYETSFEGNIKKYYGIAPTTTMTKLHELASSVNDMTSAMHSYRDTVVLKDFSILENLGDDAAVLFDYATAKRELRVKVGDPAVYQKEFDTISKEYDLIKDKDYVVAVEENGKLVNKKLKADEVVDAIDKKLTDHLNNFYNDFISGNMPSDVVVYDEDDLDPASGRTIRLINVEKTMNRVWAITKQRQDASTMILGLDRLNEIMYQKRLQNIAKDLQRNGDTRTTVDIVESLHKKSIKYGIEYKPIGKIEDGYFPHLNHPDKYLEEFAMRNIDTTDKSPEEIKDLVERQKYIGRSEQSITRSHQNYMDAMLWNSQGAFIKTEADFENIAKNVGLHNRQKNTKSRTENETIAGWQRDIRSLKQYQKDIVKSYYNNMMAVIGDNRIAEFKNTIKNIDEVDKNKWAKFMELYIRDNLGYPSIFSEADIKQLPEIKSSMYWKFTDQYVSEKGNSFLKKFKRKDKNGNNVDDLFNTTQWIQNFSNLEAKYQLMTLLSRPKTFINNIVGGEPNTLINTGFRHWRGTFSLSHLKNKIDPNFNSIDDVYKWAESHGALESFLANEVSSINKIAPAEVKRAINRMVDVIKGKPDIKDMELMEIWTKSGLSEAVFDKFAFFMKASERQLRYRSFVSHYLKAKETFEASGSMIDTNDPLLISMAQRGVNATQFVYNNANRPAFSRSALGKVVSRFQLWAWNSTRFRGQILSDMKQYGIQPGSDAGKRFERMMILDMMMLGLASLLPFSLFEATLPQPLGWLSNTAAWLFGDEEDREKAFMGDLPVAVAPLQMVLPPSSRFITPIIGALYSGDWERLGSYYSWTLFPYGLLARDITRSVERPMMAPSFMLGIPLLEIDRLRTKMTKQDEVGWGPLFRKVPMEEVE
jgi:hypothetical protein